ncbi:MAG: protein kinase, partial [Thermoanaerobaculia bacterium]
HYKILAKLGSGGMGEVWRAVDIELGREVAIKVLPAEMATDADRLERFKREARTVAALNHPNIVTLFSVEDSDGVHFLTMELVEGKRLDEIIPASGLGLDRLFSIAVPLGEALAVAHDKGILHRDLKPANIMVSDDERVKILDFGLAKLLQSEIPEIDATLLQTEALTQEGMVVGTVPYMSPEQIEGKPVDHRTDIFSLGVVLYEMSTGQRPFAGGSSPALMSSILKDSPRTVTEMRDDLPRHLGRIVQRCLEKDPERRFQTMKDVRNELESLAQEIHSEEAVSRQIETRKVSKRPSIAVLPFRCAGADPDQELFADGITEDIIDGLTRNSALLVAGGHTTTRFKGQTPDPQLVGREVDVRFVLQGRVRKAGDRLRVSAQVIDATSGHQIWSQTFDRNLTESDVFELQDEIREQIVSTVSDFHGVIAAAGLREVQDRPIEELDPWECIWAASIYDKFVNADNHLRARDALERAVELEPGLALAWAYLSWVYSDEHVWDFNPQPEPMARAMKAAQRGVELDPASHITHWLLSRVHFFDGDLDGFFAAAEKSLELNSTEGSTLGLIGVYMAVGGRWDEGVALMRRAMAMNPNHPLYYHLALGDNYFRQDKYAEALEEYQKARLFSPVDSYLQVAASYAHLGRDEDARGALRKVRELQPDIDVEQVKADRLRWNFPTELLERLLDGLRKAGLEDK